VVLAMGIERKVSYDDHLIVVLSSIFKNSKDSLRVLVVTLGPFPPGFDHALRRVSKPFTFRILPYKEEKISDSSLGLLHQ
jgi:arginine utilization protein RocB